MPNPFFEADEESKRIADILGSYQNQVALSHLKNKDRGFAWAKDKIPFMPHRDINIPRPEHVFYTDTWDDTGELKGQSTAADDAQYQLLQDRKNYIY